MGMLDNLVNRMLWKATQPVGIGGSFRPNGASGIVTDSLKGPGWSVARTSAGLYTVTFAQALLHPMLFKAFMREASGRIVQVQCGDYDAAARTLQIRVDRHYGFIPLDIGSLRIIASNVIGDTSEGMLLDGNTAPSFQRVNSATDKALRVIWASSSSVEVQFPPVPLPPDFLGAEDASVHLLMNKDTNTDTAVTVDVQVFEGIGDTEMGSPTAALAAAALAEYSATLTAANLTGHPGFLNISLIPGTHTSDAIRLYAAWVEYIKAFVGYDAAADVDNEISFLAISDESLAQVR